MTQHAHLAEDLSSVAKARRFVHEALDGAPESVRGQTELPVSALATDALKYCGGFGLSVEQLDGQVRVQVCDGGAGRPVVREPSTFDRAGRDLQTTSCRRFPTTGASSMQAPARPAGSGCSSR